MEGNMPKNDMSEGVCDSCLRKGEMKGGMVLVVPDMYNLHATRRSPAMMESNGLQDIKTNRAQPAIACPSPPRMASYDL